jgi:hypothetical protein
MSNGRYEDAVNSEQAQEDNIKIGKKIMSLIVRDEIDTSKLPLPSKAMEAMRASQRVQRALIVCNLVVSNQHMEELAEAILLFIALTAGEDAAGEFIDLMLKE